MIVITQESPYTQEAIDLLVKSVAFTHSLYEEEKYYNYDLNGIDEFFMVRKDGIAIGCGAYSWVGEYYIEIKYIYLDESARGFGCGRKLVEYIEASAFKSGAEHVILETTLKHNAAISLYLSMGYSYIAPYQERVHDGQVFMAKPLPINL